MLPDLRSVIAAVVSTFIITVAVGFFASSRLIQDQITARVDTKGLDDTPVNRIALNWPEPVKIERRVDLDFAVSAKGNPVRDVSPIVEQPPRSQAPDAVAAQPAPASDVSAPEAPAPQPETRPALEPPLAIAKAADAVEDELQTSPAEKSEPLAPVGDAAAEAPIASKQVESDPAEPTNAIANSVAATNPEAIATAAPESIAAANADIPDIPLPESRPKFAARPATPEAESPAGARSALTQPARSPAAAIRRKPRKTALRPRPAPRPQAAPITTTQQLQPFDFFGLFRAQPTTLRAPATSRAPQQVSTPAAPVFHPVPVN